MYDNQEQIKDRMLKRAARMWGGHDYATEDSFDPLIGMLIAACASELENISREVAETRLRVTEKLIDMMVPDVNAGVLPAHALATAMPVENELMLGTHDQLYVATEQLGWQDHRQLFFSPAGSFKVVKGQLRAMLHSGGYARFDQHRKRTDFLKLKNVQAIAPHELWLGLKLPRGLEQLSGLSLCFDFRGKAYASNFYYLLRHVAWSANERPLQAVAGYSDSPQHDDLLQRIFHKKVLSHHAHLAHIRRFYQEKFVTLNLQQEHLVAGLPLGLYDAAADLPEETIADMESMVWLRMEFPHYIDPGTFDELSCSLNTFPVANLNKVTKIFKSRRHLNLFALSDEDYFFELEQVEDSEGNTYGESNAEKVVDVEQNYYILRREGVESFDQRAASEHIMHLLEKLKNESASFNFLDKLSFNNDLKTLSQIMARLETNMDKLPRFPGTVYLYLNMLQENQPVFINYRTTAGEAANGMRPFTLLNLYVGSHLLQGSVSLLTPTQGGRSRLSREDRMAVYKKALLTRDRIVSEEDLKAFCRVHFGKYLKRMRVAKGAQKEFSDKGGFVRTIDLYLDLAVAELSEQELRFLCKDLLVTLVQKSAGVFPFRVFINEQLIEA